MRLTFIMTQITNRVLLIEAAETSNGLGLGTLKQQWKLIVGVYNYLDLYLCMVKYKFSFTRIANHFNSCFLFFKATQLFHIFFIKRTNFSHEMHLLCLAASYYYIWSILLMSNWSTYVFFHTKLFHWLASGNKELLSWIIDIINICPRYDIPRTNVLYLGPNLKMEDCNLSITVSKIIRI